MITALVIFAVYIVLSLLIGLLRTMSAAAYFFSAGWRWKQMVVHTLLTAVYWPFIFASWLRNAMNPEETVPVHMWHDALAEKNKLYGDHAQAKTKLEVLEDYMRFRGFGDDLDSIDKQLAKDSEHNLSYAERDRLTGWTKGIFWGVRTAEDGPSWRPEE
jgi:hypothetical protein